MICIFTSDVSRMASKEAQEAFQKSFRSLNTDSTSASECILCVVNNCNLFVLNNINPVLHAH